MQVNKNIYQTLIYKAKLKMLGQKTDFPLLGSSNFAPYLIDIFVCLSAYPFCSLLPL